MPGEQSPANAASSRIRAFSADNVVATSEVPASAGAIMYVGEILEQGLRRGMRAEMTSTTQASEALFDSNRSRPDGLCVWRHIRGGYAHNPPEGPHPKIVFDLV
jgi:hypothetical protein